MRVLSSKRPRKPGPPIAAMYQQIPLSCECGQQPARLREVGLTADRQLVIYWRCSACRRHMYIVKPLAECWSDCPAEDSVEAGAVPAATRLVQP